jgi:hypothetical protein
MRSGGSEQARCRGRPVFDSGDAQIILAAEMVKEGAFVHPGSRAKIGHRCRGKAFGPDNRHGGVRQAQTGRGPGG